MRKPNDCGVGWKKSNDRGDYISIALDLTELLELTGGVVDRVNITMYPIISDNPKAPDYQLKHYPKTGSTPGGTRPSQPTMPDDDDIPFAWLLPLAIGLLCSGLFA